MWRNIITAIVVTVTIVLDGYIMLAGDGDSRTISVTVGVEGIQLLDCFSIAA